MALRILSDIHGRTHALPDKSVDVQIGDLANCVYSSAQADRECLDWALQTRTSVCIGNHEYPHFNDDCRFSGFYRDPETGILLRKLEREGLLAPAYYHRASDTLITHAGLVDVTLAVLPAFSRYNWLIRRWQENNKHPVFSQVGRARGGQDERGGILWSDWSEPKAQIKQIVGHTVGSKVRRKGNSVCIDVPPGYIYTRKDVR